MRADLLAAVFGMFVLIAVATGWVAASLLGLRSLGHERLRALAQGAGGTNVALDGHGLDVDPVLARLRRMAPKKSPKALAKLQLRLTRAGYTDQHATAYFSLFQLVLPPVGALIVLAEFGLTGWRFALIGAVVAYMIPSIYLDRQTIRRQREIRNGLPDALDLLTLCVEAGTGLDQAVAKTSQELELAHPALARELRIMTTEIRAGRARLEAFKNLAERTGVEDVRTLVGMLTQADRFGTGVGQAMRMHAETSRTKRRQNAEERAGKVSVKLVFPLALCLFPALYVVVFGSALLKMMRGFGIEGPW